jgi:hypothetical protein
MQSDDGSDVDTPRPYEPLADEILRAVGRCRASLADVSDDGAHKVHMRIASNLEAIASRLQRYSPDIEREHRRRLAALGFATEEDLLEYLSASPYGTSLAEIYAQLLLWCTARLSLVNPGYAE